MYEWTLEGSNEGDEHTCYFDQQYDTVAVTLKRKHSVPDIYLYLYF